MAHPDFIPPGKKWDGKQFIDLDTRNVDDLNKLLSQYKATNALLEDRLKEAADRHEEMIRRMSPPLIAAEMNQLRTDNAGLKKQAEEQADYIKRLEASIKSLQDKPAKGKKEKPAEAKEG